MFILYEIQCFSHGNVYILEHGLFFTKIVQKKTLEHFTSIFFFEKVH